MSLVYITKLRYFPQYLVRHLAYGKLLLRVTSGELRVLFIRFEIVSYLKINQSSALSHFTTTRHP